MEEAREKGKMITNRQGVIKGISFKILQYGYLVSQGQGLRSLCLETLR